MVVTDKDFYLRHSGEKCFLLYKHSGSDDLYLIADIEYCDCPRIEIYNALKFYGDDLTLLENLFEVRDNGCAIEFDEVNDVRQMYSIEEVHERILDYSDTFPCFILTSNKTKLSELKRFIAATSPDETSFIVYTNEAYSELKIALLETSLMLNQD